MRILLIIAGLIASFTVSMTPASASVPAVFRPYCDSGQAALHIVKADASPSNPYRVTLFTNKGARYDLGQSSPRGTFVFPKGSYATHANFWNNAKTFVRERDFTAANFCS